MGRQVPEYLLRNEAASELGVSIRTLEHMVHKGLLVPQYLPTKRGMHFLLSDVQQLQLTLNGEKNPDLYQVKSLALQALSTAKRTEQRLTDIFAHLGLDIPTMPRDDSFVRGLYEDAKRGFSPSAVGNVEWLKFWSDMFFGMDEVYLELVTLVTGDDEPWKCFFDFSSEVVREMHKQQRDIPTSAQRVFLASREHLRHVSYLHCRRTVSARVADVIFDGKASAVDELEAILS